MRGSSASPGPLLERDGPLEVGVGLVPPLEHRVQHPEVAVGGTEARQPEHHGEQPPGERSEQLVERRGGLARAAGRRDLGEHCERRARRTLRVAAVEVVPASRTRTAHGGALVARLELGEREHRPGEEAVNVLRRGLVQRAQVAELASFPREVEGLHEVHARRGAVRPRVATELVARARASSKRPSSSAWVHPPLCRVDLRGQPPLLGADPRELGDRRSRARPRRRPPRCDAGQHP